MMFQPCGVGISIEAREKMGKKLNEKAAKLKHVALRASFSTWFTQLRLLT